MILDPFTCMVTAVILCSCFSVSMLMVWHYLLPRRPLLYWGLSMGCFALGSLVIALRPYIHIPETASILAANQTFILGYCLFWWGASAYRGRPPRIMAALVPALLFIPLLGWFTFITPLLSMRIVILRLFALIFMAGTIRELLSAPQRLARMERVTVGVLVLDVAMLLGMVTVQLTHADYNEPLFRNILISYYILLSLTTVITLGLSFFLMVMEQVFNEARSARELLETIIDNIPSITYLKDRDGRLMACSRGLSEVLGISKESAVGMSSRDLFPADIADRHAAEERTVLETGGVVKTEECITLDDGLHHYETIKLPVRGPDGQVTSVCGISTDITERRLAERALDETNERFMQLLETVPTVAVQGYEMDGTVLFWNRASETLYGYTAEEALGANLLDLIIPPGMREDVTRAVRHMMETGIAVPTGELQLQRKDGSPVQVHSSHALIRTSRSNPVMFCLDIDLSERKQMEDRLRHASNEWRRTFDAIPDIITILDSEHRIIRANRAAWEQLGCDVQDLLGRPCHTLFHTAGLPPPETCPHTLLLQDGQVHSVEIHDPAADTYLDVTVSPLFDPDGRLTGSIRVAHDITGLKRAGDALHESELMYRSILTASPDNITITDLEGHIRLVSPKGTAMFGTDSEHQLYGRNVTEFLVEEDRVRAAANIMLMHQGTFTGPGEYRAVRADGTPITIEANADFITGPDGLPECMIFVIRDITERKRIEDELNRKNAEIEQFIYTVSHDLRSPLVTVKTFLGYLGQDISGGELDRIAKDMEFIHTAADRMDSLLTELLDMSRVGRTADPHEAVTFQGLVVEATDSVAGQISTAMVEIRVSPDNPTLYGDRRRLLQIWQNLLDNALKYLGDQTAPVISIGIERCQDEAVFFVCDNGIGIEPEYHGKIFGIFEKLDRRTSGVGMGLTMVKRIIEMYGGRIWVESKGSGCGCCFRFTLPDAVRISTEKGGMS